LKDRSSLTSESESETFLEDPPFVMRHSPMKSHFLHLTFSSSSELEESSLEKSKFAQGSIRSRHDLLELLLVSDAVPLLVVALIARVIPVGVVILVGSLSFFLLG
jgi:hypothetical protein